MPANDLTTLANVKAWGSLGNGEVIRANVTGGGSGYGSAPTVIITPVNGGSGAAATAVLSGGAVQYVYMTAQGAGYLAPPTITFSAGAATATAQVNQVDSGDDATLSRLITEASEFFAEKVSRSVFTSATVTEFRDGNETKRIYPRESPITAVAAVVVDNVPIPAATTQVIAGLTIPVGNGYIFDAYSISLRGYLFSQGTGNIAIQYTAGYAANSEQLGTIEQGVIDLVSAWYKRRGHIGLASQTLNGQIVESYWHEAIPMSVQAIIDKFERIPSFG
jgi:hypothetical protein